MLGNYSNGIAGLQISQKALQITSQNLVNADTPGYSRQRVEQGENKHQYLGTNRAADLYKGTGVEVIEIRQIRDQFIDASYRRENSKLTFYNDQYKVLNEIENILMPSGGDDFSKTLDNLYGSISSLSQTPDSLEARSTFIASASTFLNEATHIDSQYKSLQDNLDLEIVSTTDKANAIIKSIFELNKSISKLEANGDNANDLRDQRNVMIDDLSGIIPIDVTEQLDGRVQIFAGNRNLFTTTSYQTMDLKKISDDLESYVIPVWSGSEETTEFDSEKDIPVIDPYKPMNANFDSNDGGTLKSLILARGMNSKVTYDSPNEEVSNFIIPEARKKFDNLVHDIVSMINEVVAPKDREDGPYGLDNSQYIEIFSRKDTPRYDAAGNYIEEENYDPTNPSAYKDEKTLYTIGNIVINPDVLENLNKVCISNSGEPGDNKAVEEILSQWKDAKSVLNTGDKPQKFEDYFSSYLNEIGMTGGTLKTHSDRQTVLLHEVTNQRQAVMGSSLDQEMSNLIKYQHSYNASAKVIKTIDSMIDSLFQAVR